MAGAGEGGPLLREEMSERWKEAAESIERLRENLHPGRPRGSASLPLTLSEAQAVVQARIEAEEKRQAKRAMGRSHGRDKDANKDGNVDGKNLQIVKAARLPWEKKEKNVFWLYVEVRSIAR